MEPLELREHAFDHLPLAIFFAPDLVENPELIGHLRGRLGDEGQVLGLQILTDLRGAITGVAKGDSAKASHQSAFDGVQIVAVSSRQVERHNPSLTVGHDMQLVAYEEAFMSVSKACFRLQAFRVALQLMRVDFGGVDQIHALAIPGLGEPGDREVQQKGLGLGRPMHKPGIAWKPRKKPQQRGPVHVDDMLQMLASGRLEQDQQTGGLRQRDFRVGRPVFGPQGPRIFGLAGCKASFFEVVELNIGVRGDKVEQGGASRVQCGRQNPHFHTSGIKAPLLWSAGTLVKSPICSFEL